MHSRALRSLLPNFLFLLPVTRSFTICGVDEPVMLLWWIAGRFA
ncbi:predicted protein [Sclerotinia sclerotiorum 1980 UF-70]|uniref:Uncharacterized protein n=1 Tax=Sclerotinia sclerotiorum (strain ATCC 18683 / 1980 / Ss-1) TaxID=665079 RepID=A7EMJ1_SCLS1|nr:predicted protein [Sclerotinia sclerotiorum 1980 UF-70]EDO04057.1 predicted protein [Sclerotinia sclerotiorum 1980 UF-70]